jgi:hypothetical protein
VLVPAEDGRPDVVPGVLLGVEAADGAPFLSPPPVEQPVELIIRASAKSAISALTTAVPDTDFICRLPASARLPAAIATPSTVDPPDATTYQYQLSVLTLHATHGRSEMV